MRQVLITIFIPMTLLSCNSDNKMTEKGQLTERYIEQESPFTGLFYYRIKGNEWIRQPENIMTVHETFKQGFYQSHLMNGILDLVSASRKFTAI